MAEPFNATPQADRVAAETLIRSSVLALANGAPIRDLDQLVSRNASRISHADILAGRLGSDVLGDIIGTVEQAKGNTAFNWNAATPDQIKAYLASNGFSFADHGRQGLALQGDRSATASASRDGSSADVRFGSITEHNFASTSLHAAGLSYGNFALMRAQGFDSHQIIAAVNTNKQFGLDANCNPAATARLQRDVPWAVDSLKGSAATLRQAQDHERQARDCETRGDFAGAERHRQQAEHNRQVDRERVTRTQDRLRNDKPERLDDYMKKHEEIEQRYSDAALELSSAPKPDDVAKPATNQAASAKAVSAVDDATLARNTQVIDSYIRNPNDSAARKNYAALKDASKGSKFAAMANVDKSVEQDRKLKKTQVEENKTKIAANASADADNDELAAALAGSAEKVKKAEAPKPLATSGSGHAKSGAHEEKPEKTKVAAAKPPSPKA